MYSKISSNSFLRKGLNKMENTKKIADVKCNVTNCVYHTMNNCCEAGAIEVEPCAEHCNCSTETACKTFKAKA